MGMKQSWFCDVMTINAKDPDLYKPKHGGPPASGSGASPAVFIDIEPEGVLGEFAEHIGQYAEWNINAWLFRTCAELKGCLVYNAELDTFHFCNGTDLTWPVATGELPPARSTEKDKDGKEKEPAKQPGEATKDRGFEQRKKEQAEREKAAKEQAAKAKDAKEKGDKPKGKSHETEDEREAREAREAKEKHGTAKSPFDRR